MLASSPFPAQDQSSNMEMHSNPSLTADASAAAASSQQHDGVQWTNMLVHQFEFDKLEFATPSKMSPAYIVFTCYLGYQLQDTLFTVLDIPTVVICRAEQREKACEKLGLPQIIMPAPPGQAILDVAAADLQALEQLAGDNDFPEGMARLLAGAARVAPLPSSRTSDNETHSSSTGKKTRTQLLLLGAESTSQGSTSGVAAGSGNPGSLGISQGALHGLTLGQVASHGHLGHHLQASGLSQTGTLARVQSLPCQQIRSLLSNLGPNSASTFLDNVPTPFGVTGVTGSVVHDSGPEGRASRALVADVARDEGAMEVDHPSMSSVVQATSPETVLQQVASVSVAKLVAGLGDQVRAWGLVVFMHPGIFLC